MLRLELHNLPRFLIGRPENVTVGAWIFKAFFVLTALKGLRGSVFDPFGRNTERVDERELIEDYFLRVIVASTN